MYHPIADTLIGKTNTECHRDRDHLVAEKLPEEHADESDEAAYESAEVYCTVDAKAVLPSLGGADLSHTVVRSTFDKIPLAGPDHKNPNEINHVKESLDKSGAENACKTTIVDEPPGVSEDT